MSKSRKTKRLPSPRRQGPPLLAFRGALEHLREQFIRARRLQKLSDRELIGHVRVFAQKDGSRVPSANTYWRWRTGEAPKERPLVTTVGKFFLGTDHAKLLHILDTNREHPDLAEADGVRMLGEEHGTRRSGRPAQGQDTRLQENKGISFDQQAALVAAAEIFKLGIDIIVRATKIFGGQTAIVGLTQADRDAVHRALGEHPAVGRRG